MVREKRVYQDNTRAVDGRTAKNGGQLLREEAAVSIF
jgi:hypothetical protein